MGRSLRLALAVGLVLVALAAGAGRAFAHARLVRSEPAGGAVLPSPPRAVRVFFDDDVVAAGGNEAVRNGGGSVLRGEAQLAPGNRRELVIPLRAGLPEGDYSVRWRVVSDDGHLITGVLAFAVGVGRAPPKPTLSAGGSEPSAGDVVSRWLFFTGLLLAAGTGGFSLAVWRPALRRARAPDRRHARFSVLLAGGSVLMLIGGSLELNAALTATRFGLVTLIGVLGAAGIAALAAASFAESRLLVLAQGAALPLVLVPTLAGHAVDPGRSWIEPSADVLHVASAAVWFGGLVAVFVLVPGLRDAVFATRVVRRFSVLALGAVALLSLTGLVRALSELTSFHQLWSIGYGRAILVKTGLLAALLALAWVNRYRLVPRLPEAHASTRLRESMGAEVALFVGLVVAVAVLVQLRPGRDVVVASARPGAPPLTVNVEPPPPPPPGALLLAREAGTLAVALAVEPARRTRLTATVLASSGEALSGLPLSFRLGPGEERSLRARPCGHGCYTAEAPPGARPRVVEVLLRGGSAVVFRLPRSQRPAGALVRRAARVFRNLSSLVYVESLSSGPGRGLLTTWRLRAPDQVSYQIRGGSAAVVIGRRRWDRDGAGRPWRRSSQLPPLRVPQPAWGDVAVDAHVIGTGRVAGRPVWVVTFANPTVPAWFTAWIERRSYRTLRLRMTAAAHFMVHRYEEFDLPLRIRPPK